MTDPTRRAILAAPAMLALAPAFASAAPPSRANDDLARYIGFGSKASGGPGDDACGAWIEGELRSAGYATARQGFDAPFFATARAELAIGDTRAPVIPQAVVVPTGANGVTGPLVRFETGTALPVGAIALVVLPHQRWSSAIVKAVRAPVDAAIAGGAAAVVIVTTGPSGEALALNAPADTPLFAQPVAVLAPNQAAPFLAAAARGGTATLTVTGRGGRRPAFNLAGRIDRGKARAIVLSTPRSGWFGCAGERGPGLAAWLALARWAPRALPDHDLVVLCNSGHEYEYLGAERALDAAPPPDRTALWLHLGANVAARDWHAIGGALLAPLPSADPQRFLVTSEALVAAARTAFRGLPGLEAAYPAAQGTAGELATIVAAGYRHAAGIFGAHPLHHAASDDARCIDGALVDAVVRASTAFVAAVAHDDGQQSGD